MDRKRLFFALWPDAPIRAQLSSVAASLHSVPGRRVAADHLHLTLIFLGDVDVNRQDCAQRAAAGVAGRQFDLLLDVLGYWRRAQIVWLGCSRAPTELLSLVNALQANLIDCGFAPEARAYRPHVTLARKAQKNFAGATIAPVCWPVTRFVLMESIQEQGGVRYAILESWNLMAA